MCYLKSENKMLKFGIIVLLCFGNSIAEVYDITTIYKFAIPSSNGSSDYYQDYLESCENISCVQQTGWASINSGQIKLPAVSTDGKYRAVGGISSTAAVPSNEFVISFKPIGKKIFIFLLADNDIIKSDMIMIEISSQPKVSLCQDYSGIEYQELPNGTWRKCVSKSLVYNLEYFSNNEHSSLFIQQDPDLKVIIPGENLGSGILPASFYDVYENEINIKFVAVGDSSGTASFNIWPSFRILRLSKPQGIITKGTYSGSLIPHGSPICLSLKYYLQPNTGATIQVFVEDIYGNQINLGNVTASKTESEMLSMTTHHFTWPFMESPLKQYKIVAEKHVFLDNILIGEINECHDSDSPNFTTINQRGSVEVHAMTNARGLPLLLHNEIRSSQIGNNLPACTALDGDCVWTVSNWTSNSVNVVENPPLQFTVEKTFTEYTMGNISNPHVFYDNSLTFKYQGTSDTEMGIFLLNNNPNILLGNMYYINLSDKKERVNDYYRNYNHYTRRLQKQSLYKCTSINKNLMKMLPNADSRNCNLMQNEAYDINHSGDSIHLCEFKIYLSSGKLKLSSICGSTERLIFDWTDTDPLNIVYYRFGTWGAVGEFNVNTDYSKVWQLTHDEGSITSPTFVPRSRTLCVSLTYYLHSVVNNILKLSALWTDGYSQDFDTLHGIGEWKTVRLVMELPAEKQAEQINIILRGKKSGISYVLIQRISGCNDRGVQDVYFLSDDSPTVIRSSAYDVAVIQTKKSSSISAQLNCTNGGIFDEERDGCVCPAGFTGSTCDKACGKNRFGATCKGLCSETNNGCRGMVLCHPGLGCSCATGLKGFLCEKECELNEYGAGCKQTCGFCKDSEFCDKYTGECSLGCEPGYYPPLCQKTYKYVSEAPQVIATGYNTYRITANLKKQVGTGTPRFYQFQYKEEENDSWLEMEPNLILSSNVMENISGLKSGVDYQVRVVLLDEDGNSYQGSNVSVAVIISKDKDVGSDQDSIISVAEISHNCTVPDSLHYDLQTTSITENSFWITWKFIHESPLWCTVTEFVVERKEGLQWLKHYQGSKMTAEFSNMLSGHEYQIRVQALSYGKPYPFSEIIHTTTKFGAPGKVSELHLVSSHSQELKIEWSSPLTTAGTILQYKVSYKCQHLLGCRTENCSHSSGEVNVESTSTVLSGLIPHAQYAISVSALSSSWGAAKQILAVTNMTVPGVSPDPHATSTVIQRTNSSFTVQWFSPHNCTYINGYLQEYRFELLDQNKSTPIQKGNTHLTTVTFSHLMPQTRYIVKVYLVTLGGWSSSHSLKIDAQTTATTPDPVEQLTVYKKGRRVLGVRWAPPKQTYGNLKSFTVSYQAISPHNKVINAVMEPIPCVPWPHLFCHMANNLRPDTQYKILVQAQNAEVSDVGAPASVIAITKESVPTSPSYVQLVSQTQTDFTVEWGIPDMLNGMLRSFLVNVEETDSFNFTECCQYFPVKEVAVREEKSSYKLTYTGLKPASTYTISISAKTVALGPAVFISVHTRPSVPSMDDLIEIPNNSSSLSESSIIKMYSSTEYEDLIRGYLLLVLPLSNEVKVPETSIYDEWLGQEINSHVNGTYYFAAEFLQDELLESPDVVIGSGGGLKVGKWGEMQNSELENEMEYRLGLVLILEYCGILSVGYTETPTFIVDY